MSSFSTGSVGGFRSSVDYPQPPLPRGSTQGPQAGENAFVDRLSNTSEPAIQSIVAYQIGAELVKQNGGPEIDKTALVWLKQALKEGCNKSAKLMSWLIKQNRVEASMVASVRQMLSDFRSANDDDDDSFEDSSLSGLRNDPQAWNETAKVIFESAGGESLSTTEQYKIGHKIVAECAGPERDFIAWFWLVRAAEGGSGEALQLMEYLLTDNRIPREDYEWQVNVIKSQRE